MRFITTEDFKDIYIKFHQRGLQFLFSKLKLDGFARTQSAFNEKEIESANYWTIPAVRKRLNYLITGNPEMLYEEYLTENYFKNRSENIKVLALGSGVCSHELRLAELNPNWEISCFDFSSELLDIAADFAKERGLTNISFHAENILKFQFEKQYYDVVFFHASLHHFDHISEFFQSVIVPILKPDGKLMINEFVGKNRLQYSNNQIVAINKAIDLIPKKYRRIYKTNIFKNKYTSSGIWRMIIADPSECVDSEGIMPAIRQYFDVVIERSFGNNLLQSVFKDIAQHFQDENLSAEKLKIVNDVFALEDEFLKDNPSDSVFGIYQLKQN